MRPLLELPPGIARRLAMPVARGHAHLVGIGGAGMRSLARVLDGCGWSISGSDMADVVAVPRNWQVVRQQEADFFPRLPDVVIHSPAIAANHAEVQLAHRLNIPQLSYPEMLGQLMLDRQGLAVAGTHGKSTTVAMTAAILTAAGLDPSVVAGAEPLAGNELSRYGRGRHIVVEACEYRGSFWHLEPQLAAILNIEPDHFDCYPTTTDLHQAFLQFARKLPPDGTLVVSAHCPAARWVATHVGRRVLTFGLNTACDIQGRIIETRRGYCRLELRLLEGRPFTVQLAVPGTYNANNALAAAALAMAAGANVAAIQQGLQNFRGLRRRLETVGTAAGITFVDDYAHHPTEITAALSTVRQCYPGARVWCVFEPHQASRTKSLLDELAESLQNADTLAVAEICRAREPAWQEGEVTAEDLVQQVGNRGPAVADARTFPDIHDWLLGNWQRGTLRAGDVVVTLGAGNPGTLAHGVYEWIRNHCSNR